MPLNENMTELCGMLYICIYCSYVCVVDYEAFLSGVYTLDVMQ